jgi:methyl-accepting chemotaxis protein
MITQLKRLMRGVPPPAAAQSAVAHPAYQPAPSEIPPEVIRRLADTFNLLEIDVTRLIDQVVEAAGTTQKEVTAFAVALDDIKTNSGALAVSADHAAREVSQLATATNELTRSGDKIHLQLRDASALAHEAKQTTSQARSSATSLRNSSAEIAPIAGLIDSIAQRTNLLALNATIEAAHAGVAGAGFAVVASEVKSLANETQKATAAISQRIENLQNDTSHLIQAVDNIGAFIDGLWPVISAIAGAVEEQTRTTAELSRSTGETSRFVSRVSTHADAIASVATSTAKASLDAQRSVQDVFDDAAKLRARFVIFLRETEAGSRRRRDRLPCERPVTFHCNGQVFTGHTIDLSEGGALIALPNKRDVPLSGGCVVTIDGCGRCAGQIRGQSAFGFHIQWQTPSLEFMAKLGVELDKIRQENAPLIVKAREAAQSVSNAFEEAVLNRHLTMEALFDAHYQLIDGSDPAQYTNTALTVLESFLPALQESLVDSDPQLIFGFAIDRNGWVPVHNRRYSMPQRRGDTAWNIAHCRNRRIFDDRAGLAAARNVRPSLIQTYNRDLGLGNFVLMKEVDAPIRVFDRHWGGFRMAYKI